MWKFWQSKPKDVEQPQPVVKALEVAPVKVADFSPETHQVYWETHLDQVADGTWSAEVRFIGWGGHNHRSQHNLYGPTKENVEQLVHKLIADAMHGFRK